MTKVSALQRRSGWRGEAKPLDPASITLATTNANVTINGQDYVLFTQPYPFAGRPASIDGKAQQWVVAGLVSASRFRYDVTGISINVVLVAMAIALLAICCWPYLRIAFIHPTQALTIGDVVLIVICTIVGAAVLTVAVLDGIAYLRIVAAADAQLWRFGDGINEDFGNDIERATIVLDRFGKMSPVVKPGSYGIQSSFRTNPIVATYPYVETLSWIDRDGMQQVKFAQEPSALVPVNERRYFKEALAGITWTVKGRPYILEWVRSTATGDVRAVLAKRSSHPKYPVIALGTELIDVTHAVAPPGWSWPSSMRMETSSITRHAAHRLRELFLGSRSEPGPALGGAVATPESVDAPYWGEDQSMYVRPLVGSPWTLVTFRAKRLTRVLNVEGVLLTLMLLLLGATPYLSSTWPCSCSRLTIARHGVPDSERWGDYLRLCLSSSRCLVLVLLPEQLRAPAVVGVLRRVDPADRRDRRRLFVLHRRDTPKRFAIAGPSGSPRSRF